MLVCVLCSLPLLTLAWYGNRTSTRSRDQPTHCLRCGGKLYYGGCPKCNPDAGRIPMRKKSKAPAKRPSSIVSARSEQDLVSTNRVEAAKRISTSDVDREVALMNLKSVEQFKNHRCPYRSVCEHCKKLFDEKRLTKTYCDSCYVCKGNREKAAREEQELRELMNAAKSNQAK